MAWFENRSFRDLFPNISRSPRAIFFFFLSLSSDMDSIKLLLQICPWDDLLLKFSDGCCIPSAFPLKFLHWSGMNIHFLFFVQYPASNIETQVACIQQKLTRLKAGLGMLSNCIENTA